MLDTITAAATTATAATAPPPPHYNDDVLEELFPFGHLRRRRDGDADYVFHF